jgi:hypothetical protein
VIGATGIAKCLNLNAARQFALANFESPDRYKINVPSLYKRENISLRQQMERRLFRRKWSTRLDHCLVHGSTSLRGICSCTVRKRMAQQQLPLETLCQEWIGVHLGHFRIDWNWDTTEIYKNLKPYGELVLLTAVNRDVRHGSLYELQDRLLVWLNKNRPNVNRLAEVVREFPQVFPWLGLIWQSFELAEVRVPGLRAAMLRLLEIRGVLHFERHVGHDICVHHIIESLGRTSPYDLRELYSRTMIARDAWDNASDTALYHICHDIFFLTNWGLYQLPSQLRPSNSWIAKLLHWYRRCLASSNVDLAAELFIALSLLQAKGEVKSLACAARRSAQASGLPRPPKGQGEGFISPGDSDDRVQFFRNYHTVIVCLMALGMRW